MATVVSPSSRCNGVLCLPLACGAWHERAALDEALQHPESVRVAQLFHRVTAPEPGGRWQDEAFYLAVTFKRRVPPVRATHAVMGLSLDERGHLGWTVCDARTGAELLADRDDSLQGLQAHWREERRREQHEGRLPPRRHHRQAIQVAHATHALCNRLLAVADQHSARLALNDVRYLRTLRPRVTHPQAGDRPARTTSGHEAVAERHYRRATLVVGSVLRILGYKAVWRGLPSPLAVHGISPRDGPVCGTRSAQKDICTSCTRPLDVLTAARVTAQRVLDTLDQQAAAWTQRSPLVLADVHGDPSPAHAAGCAAPSGHTSTTTDA